MHSDPLKQYENGTVQYEKRTSFKKWFLNGSLDMFLSQRDFTLPSLIQKRSLLWSLFFFYPQSIIKSMIFQFYYMYLLL